MSVSAEVLLGELAPSGNSATALRALVGVDGRVRLELRDDDDGGRTWTVWLADGDRVEVTTTIAGNAQCVISESEVSLVRDGRREAIASFSADTQWGGVLHRDVVAALRPACEAAGAIIVEQEIER